MASEASFSQYTTNFLNLLIDQNRIEALENICESFEKSYCALTDTQVCACMCCCPASARRRPAAAVCVPVGAALAWAPRPLQLSRAWSRGGRE